VSDRSSVAEGIIADLTSFSTVHSSLVAMSSRAGHGAVSVEWGPAGQLRKLWPECWGRELSLAIVQAASEYTRVVV